MAVAATANYNDKISTSVLAPYSALINLTTDRTVDAWGCGWAYTHINTLYTIQANVAVTVGGTSDGNRRVAVASGTVGIILNAAAINVSSTDNAAALLLNNGADVTVTLTGSSTLQSGSNCAGIQAPDGTTLTITGGPGSSLTAQGGTNGTGSGSGSYSDGGAVTINGGTVYRHHRQRQWQRSHRRRLRRRQRRDPGHKPGGGNVSALGQYGVHGPWRRWDPRADNHKWVKIQCLP